MANAYILNTFYVGIVINKTVITKNYTIMLRKI